MSFCSHANSSGSGVRNGVSVNSLEAMEPTLETVGEKILVGKRVVMSLVDNRTGELWRSFMPRRKDIPNSLGTALYSLQVYESHYFNPFSPENPFEKWAAVEVKDVSSIPEQMEVFTIPAGLYAVFHYKGLNTDTTIYRTIFNSWLPNSPYVLDNRPHFEMLGEKYKNDDPDSEEDIWIPIRLKG